MVYIANVTEPCVYALAPMK